MSKKGKNKKVLKTFLYLNTVSLGYVTSNFVATNNKDFKTLKDIADFYLRYNKTPRNRKQKLSNHIKWNFLKRLEKSLVFTSN